MAYICIYFSFLSADFEDDMQAGLPMNVFIKWRKAALLVCWMSIFFEFVLGFISLGKFFQVLSDSLVVITIHPILCRIYQEKATCQNFKFL